VRITSGILKMKFIFSGAREQRAWMPGERARAELGTTAIVLCTGDPSLLLKNGSGQDDAIETRESLTSNSTTTKFSSVAHTAVAWNTIRDSS